MTKTTYQTWKQEQYKRPVSVFYCLKTGLKVYYGLKGLEGLN